MYQSSTTAAAWLRRTVGLAVLVAAVVVLPRESPALIGLRPAEALDWLRITSPDQVVTSLAGALGWLCVCWLTASVSVIALGQLPGWLGTTCRTVAAAVTPRLLRRTVEALLGTALAGGSVAAALPAGAVEPAPPARTPAATSAWAAPAHPATSLAAADTTWPDLDRPASASASAPARSAPPAPRVRAAPAHGAAAITVRSGDTLWGIARRELRSTAPSRSPKPASVALAWPRWYAANRGVIGPDPDVLRPGQVLQAPQDRSAQ